MANKRNQIANADLYGQDESIDAGAQRIFGLTADKARDVVKEFLIDKIWPDLEQPRKTIPRSVCGKWDGNPTHLGAIFNRWVSMASQEMGEQLAVGILLEGMLDGESEYATPPDQFPIANSLMKVISLASNILKVGMIHPITISEWGKNYKINTGERRYLAHHLLTATVGGDDFKKIKGLVVTKNVWQQVSENGAREELNAISTARGFALLLMDMHKEDVEFRTYEAALEQGDSDQAFYAQAADLRIKRGLGQDVITATGLKSKGNLYHYRNLLTIPERVWMQADTEDWTEFAIREHVNLINGKQTKITTPPEPDEGYKSTGVDLSPDFGNQPESQNGESSQRMATPTGVVPSVVPGQALGRDQQIKPLFTSEWAQSMTSIQLDDILINSQRWMEFRNGYDVHDIITAEIQRRRDKMGLKDDPAPDTTPEPVERAVEDETPVVAHNNVARTLLLNLQWAAGQRKEGVLDKDINELLTISPQMIYEWISTSETEDMDWFKSMLDERYADVMDFVIEIMVELMQELWDEGQRMRVKYPFETKE